MSDTLLQVRLVTTWNTPCGIADYAAHLMQAVRAADPTIAILPDVAALDGASDAVKALIHDPPTDDLVVLNFHEGIFRNWPIARVRELRQSGYTVVVIAHNTFGEHTPAEMRATGDTRLDFLDQLVQTAAADAVIVHEPCRGLAGPNVQTWQQGVPAPQPAMVCGFGQLPSQPILGTVGFNLPWKNFDRVAQVSAACGWACLISSADATADDAARWQRDNPHALIRTGFRPPSEIVSSLSGCDATIFAYEGAGAGTSGAIRLGLAARKPLIAWRNRQFRDLWEDGTSRRALHWCGSFDDLPGVLAQIPIQRLDPGIVQIAERESWTRLGGKYAALFRSLCP